ncbi:MAG: hypothetical protein QM703_01645 [Gemmatales bacterium]
MTLTLQLPVELEQRLRQRAIEQGKGLEQYAQEVLETDVKDVHTAALPKRKPLAGRLEHLRLQIPSLEEFQEARREMCANFPREFPKGNDE